jgi:hypothetical protein
VSDFNLSDYIDHEAYGVVDREGYDAAVSRAETAEQSLREAREALRNLLDGCETVVLLEYDPRRRDSENDELQRRGRRFRKLVSEARAALSDSSQGQGE